MKITAPLLITAILVSGIIGFFVGRNFSPTQDTASIATDNSLDDEVKEKAYLAGKVIPSETMNLKEEETENEVVVAAVIPDKPTTASSDPTTISSTNEEEKETASTAYNNTSSPVAMVLKRVNMGISDKKISEVLKSVAGNLELQRLAYVSALGQDCSGIFHKIKDSIQVRLPTLAQNSGYDYPVYAKDRSSRQIADWYYQKNNLLIVEDPISAKNSIRPGAVMFYGKPNKKYSNMTIESLTDRDNNYTPNGSIMHVAVVTSVRTDEKGNVLDYTIMHGRNTRIHASRSGSKEIQSRNTHGLPPFGNWSQQWVAIANIATKAL